MKKGVILSMVFGLSLVAASACDCVKSCEAHAPKSCGCKDQGEKYSATMKAIGIQNVIGNSHCSGKMKGEMASLSKEGHLKNLSAMVGINGCKNSCGKTSTLYSEKAISSTGAILSKDNDESTPILFSNDKKEIYLGEMIVGSGDRANVRLLKKCVNSVCEKVKGHVFSKSDSLFGIAGEKNNDGTVSIKSGAEVSLILFEK